MAQTGISERLLNRIRWLGEPDPTWTEEDGRSTTPWAVTRALSLLENIARSGLLEGIEPGVTATARGGVEFVWDAGLQGEVNVIIPAGGDDPFEVVRIQRRGDGSIVEDEWSVSTIDEAIALIVSPGP